MLFYLLPVLVIVATVLADQVSKLLVVHFLYEKSIAVIPGILSFTYVENRGMAFGLLADKRWIFLVFSTVGIVLIAFYLFRYAKTRLARVSLALVVGGGIGNMIDRVALGFVVDFIDVCAFPSFWYWVFNIADSAVCVGAALYVLSVIFEIIEEEKMKKSGAILVEPASERPSTDTEGQHD